MPKTIFCICGTKAVKNGRTSSNVQRYRCLSCGKSFLADNNSTGFLKHSGRMIKQFIGFMIDDVSLEVAARNLSIDIKTAHYYRHLVFDTLKDYQTTIKLNGTVLIDETFIPIREKAYKLLRADGKDFRGLSFNQLCIITMIDLNGIGTAKVSSRASAQPEDFIRLFNMNIGNIHLIIHDGNPKQVQFMKQFDCPRINPRKSDLIEYSTDLVDAYHSSLKRYLFKHAGFKLKNTQHYLNFFVYRYNNLSKDKKSNKKTIISVKEKMITDLYKKVNKADKRVKYIDYMKDLGITDILENIR